MAPETAAAAIGESKALCEAVQPFLDQLNDQEKLLEDTSQHHVADRAVRSGNTGQHAVARSIAWSHVILAALLHIASALS